MTRGQVTWAMVSVIHMERQRNIQWPSARRHPVPVEQTPVPILTSRVRDQSQSLLEKEDAPEGTDPSPAPTIIEVPQWLARLEPGFAAMERKEIPSPESLRVQSKQEPGSGRSSTNAANALLTRLILASAPSNSSSSKVLNSRIYRQFFRNRKRKTACS